MRRCPRPGHYSSRTERAYVAWIKRFILYHGERHPAQMGTDEIRRFLPHLAADRTVAAATRNRAPCPLLPLYRDVLGVGPPYVEGIERDKRPARVPVVLTREEADLLLSRVSGTYR